MAEHSSRDFEHEFEESFRRLDESIKIPEIPDAQSIFERAENEKPKVLPFKKYSRIIAAAAAVVLICVAVPVFGSALSSDIAAESEPQAMTIMDGFFDSMRSDSKSQDNAAVESEIPMETEMLEEPEVAPEVFPESEEGESGSDFRYALEDFFFMTTSANGPVEGASGNGELKEQSSSSSSEEDSAEVSDGAELLEEKLNKKRSIEISVEEDSVSVVLFDISAGDEIISAFWVEGKFVGSGKDGENYVINLTKTITEEEFESGFFVPMAGDAENGTYSIPEENILVPGEVTKGVIILTVEIDIGTGEYKIYASLV